MDFFDRTDIESSIRRIEELLSCGIFRPENQSNVLFRAAFIELLIALRDLMYKCRANGLPITFDDDVTKTKDVQNVAGLIKYVRDALCHPDSDNHYIEAGNIKASFNVMFGKGCLLKLNNFEQSSAYADDVCFFFGSQGIYLKRHIIRAFEEAKGKLIPLVKAAELAERQAP